MRIPTLFAAAALALAAAPAGADEIEAALEAALEAWRAGDARRAQEELDFAATLLGEAKARGLGAFLPAPFDGWTREDGAPQGGGPALFVGGSAASAAYRRGSDEIEIQVTADSPVVAAMAAVFSNPQMMALQGEVRRAGRQRYVVAPSGEITAMIDGRILVRLSGSAAVEDKIAYFEAIDLDGLARY